MKKFLTTTIALISILSLVTGVTAHAVDTPGQALEIAPPVINLKADPGQTISTTINLRDISSQPLVVTGTVDDFTANGEDGIPKILLDQAEPTLYSIKSWVQPLSKLTLKSRQIEALPVTIVVPKDASPGGYYGVIRFTTTAPGMESSGVSLSASLGALIFLRVNGQANEALAFDNFYTSREAGGNSTWLFENQPIIFNEKIKNSGNVFEQPTGQITVKDMFGNLVANVNVNLERRSILPGTSRRLSQSLDKTNIGDRILFGYYKAHITMNYGESNKQISQDISFWVIPWKLIASIVVGIIIVALVGRMLIKRYVDGAVTRSRGSRRR
jgi:hypothetical protein